jgi:hypothetical protein
MRAETEEQRLWDWVAAMTAVAAVAVIMVSVVMGVTGRRLLIDVTVIASAILAVDRAVTARRHPRGFRIHR